MLKITKDEFIRRAQNLHGDKYDYSKVNLSRLSDKITIVCPNHGEFYEQPRKHLEGHGCSQCALENRQKSFEEFCNEANQIHTNKYTYDEQTYVGRHKKLKILCPTHGEFWQRVGSHLRGSGCPCCSESKGGERKIRELLTNKNLNFECQKEFEWLLSSKLRPLKLDFFLTDYNCCIEFQGEQHYRPINWSGKLTQLELTSQLKEVQERDILKKELLEKHDIKLYYIKYDEDIELRLNQILIELN